MAVEQIAQHRPGQQPLPQRQYRRPVDRARQLPVHAPDQANTQPAFLDRFADRRDPRRGLILFKPMIDPCRQSMVMRVHPAAGKDQRARGKGHGRCPFHHQYVGRPIGPIAHDHYRRCGATCIIFHCHALALRPAMPAGKARASDLLMPLVPIPETGAMSASHPPAATPARFPASADRQDRHRPRPPAPDCAAKSEPALSPAPPTPG